MVKDTNKRVMVTLPNDILEKINILASQYGLSLSDIVKVMVVDNLKERNMM